MEESARAELLRSWALAAGFDRAGIAGLAPSEHGATFRAWLARGEHGSMGYMARRVETRLQPGSTLDGAKSALCVALRYAPLAGEDEATGDLWPRVARYARGRDYHDLMERRLEGLGRRIARAFPGTRWRRSVDAGPVLERELAARAGIGVFGKNTCLLDREMGSWFLLGELFLTLDLPEDGPGVPSPSGRVADLCGSCTLCLQACPTGALVAPYRLDASRCISHWTIEEHGSIPPAARAGNADWVFGCDICQEVCPWNRRRHELAPADHPELRLPPERRELDLAGLLLLDEDGYRQRFRHSPMKRPHLPGLQRNAAVAMGNRGDRGAVAPLVAALRTHREPLVREHAAWALGRLGGEESARALTEALTSETETSVREAIAEALRESATTLSPTE